MTLCSSVSIVNFEQVIAGCKGFERFLSLGRNAPKIKTIYETYLLSAANVLVKKSACYGWTNYLCYM